MPGSQSSSVGREWKTAAVALFFTVLVQLAGWVYWFGGWKGEVDLRLNALEAAVKDLPDAVKRIDITQQVMNSKLNDLLNRDRADRYREADPGRG